MTFNSITIETDGPTKDIYESFGLILTNMEYSGTPELQTAYQNIPGRNSVIDFSCAIVGYEVFNKREISFALEGVSANPEDWDKKISQLRNFCHGKRAKITTANEPEFYYSGRITVTDFEAALHYGKVLITLTDADPYKHQKRGVDVSGYFDGLSKAEIDFTARPASPFTVQNTVPGVSDLWIRVRYFVNSTLRVTHLASGYVGTISRPGYYLIESAEIGFADEIKVESVATTELVAEASGQIIILRKSL